jgi:hypothetical protein
MSKRLRFKSENRDAILDFVECADGSVVLNDIQQTMLMRARFADELMRQEGEFCIRENVLKRVMEHFDVSRDTANKDIVFAQDIFYTLSPLNKKFEIQRKIELLNRTNYEIKKSMYDDKGVYCFDNDKHNIIARNEGIIQKYLSEFPEFIEARSPKNINYIIVQNNLTINNTVTVEKANQNYDDVLKRLKDREDY